VTFDDGQALSCVRSLADRKSGERSWSSNERTPPCATWKLLCQRSKGQDTVATVKKKAVLSQRWPRNAMTKV